MPVFLIFVFIGGLSSSNAQKSNPGHYNISTATIKCDVVRLVGLNRDSRAAIGQLEQLIDDHPITGFFFIINSYD